MEYATRGLVGVGARGRCVHDVIEDDESEDDDSEEEDDEEEEEDED